jgi:hypothetical protein
MVLAIYMAGWLIYLSVIYFSHQLSTSSFYVKIYPYFLVGTGDYTRNILT